MFFLSDSSASIKILLQIRAGDAAISKQNDSDHFDRKVRPLVNMFTDCALAMEAQIKSVEQNANRSVIWYLMADSSAVREYVKTNFSDRVIST
jgi:hypothetical protein